MLPTRLRPTAVLTALAVALFSATPSVRMCSVSWADVRPECFVTCSEPTMCAAAKPQCGASRSECETDRPECATSASSCGSASALAGTADVAPDTEPEGAPPPATPKGTAAGKRAFCLGGAAGGPGEPASSFKTPSPAKAKALASASTPKLQPLTVHRPRAEHAAAANPRNRPGAPSSPRAPPKNVFLHGLF